MSYFYSIVQFINIASIARSIVFGLLASLALTQFIKVTFPQRLPDTWHRVVTRGVAFLVAMGVCLFTWPVRTPDAWAISLTTGLVSPVGYKVAVATLYHYVPWLEPYLSARPRATP